MPEMMKAAGRVNNPITMSTPPISSISPAAPLIVMGDALFIGPTGKLRYLVVPCCRRSSPDIMRRRLRSCAEYGRRKFMACLQQSRLRFVRAKDSKDDVRVQTGRDATQQQEAASFAVVAKSLQECAAQLSPFTLKNTGRSAS